MTIGSTSSAATAQSPALGCSVGNVDSSPLTVEAGSCTRSGAQRRRDKRRARELRSGDDAGGLLGEVAPGPLSNAWGNMLTRADLVDLRKAIRGDWNIPEVKRLAFLALLWRTFQVAENWPRLSLAVAWTVIAMEDANIRDERRQRREVAMNAKRLC